MKNFRVLIISAFLIFCTHSVFAEGGNLRIHFIDVEEGDSTLIQTPKGASVLVDAGNPITGVRVAGYLNEEGVEGLDYLILTHPHVDHIGGTFHLLQTMDVKRVCDNGDSFRKSDVFRWYDKLVRNDDRYSVLKEADSFSLDEVSFKVIWPPQPLVFSNGNANSMVIMVEFKDFRCLLTADLTVPGEKMLLKKKEDVRADLLKVSHHGANDASSIEFLEKVSPGISVMSVKGDTMKGYASPKVLKRLKDIGSKIYRTDKDGDVIVDVDINGNVKVETTRR
ncbi:MBL fold metallo-hydrolase [Omnitrophica bacterium]|nr:MBL fold metallo-hydrolase [Candidatus Omnitrophota bacterium]